MYHRTVYTYSLTPFLNYFMTAYTIMNNEFVYFGCCFMSNDNTFSYSKMNSFLRYRAGNLLVIQVDPMVKARNYYHQYLKNYSFWNMLMHYRHT